MTSPRRRQIRRWISDRRQHGPIKAPNPIPKTWLLRYYVYRHGHKLAYFLLGLGCFLALLQVNSLQTDQGKTSKALGALVKNIQVNRKRTIETMCSAQNRVTLRLRALIVQGAKSSKLFEPIYRSYGAPPYRVRVRQAERQARSLRVVPCNQFVHEIEALTPPPPNLP